MKILGITGTLGAGKGTVVDYLISKKGFIHYSVRALLVEEIQLRELEINRDNMVAVANDLRAANSPAWIVEQLYEQAEGNGHDCVIESIRSPGEVEALANKGNFAYWRWMPIQNCATNASKPENLRQITSVLKRFRQMRRAK